MRVQREHHRTEPIPHDERGALRVEIALQLLGGRRRPLRQRGGERGDVLRRNEAVAFGVVPREGSEHLLLHRRERAHLLHGAVAGEEQRVVRLRCDDPDRRRRPFEESSDLEVAQSLELRQEPHRRPRAHAAQPDVAAEVALAVEDVGRRLAEEEEVEHLL